MKAHVSPISGSFRQALSLRAFEAMEEESSPVAIAISVMLMGSIGFQMLMSLVISELYHSTLSSNEFDIFKDLISMSKDQIVNEVLLGELARSGHPALFLAGLLECI